MQGLGYGKDDLLVLTKLLDLAHTWTLLHEPQQTGTQEGGMSFSEKPRNRPKPSQVTWEELVALGVDATGQGKEVLTHMYQSILKIPEFTLADGTKCRVDALSEPTRWPCRLTNEHDSPT